MVTGRQLRNWWKSLSPEEKAEYKRRLRTYKYWFLGLAALAGVFGLHNYYTHIQEAPVTGRRRYISLTPEQSNIISEFVYELIWELEELNDRLIPENHPVYKIIKDTITRLVDANQDIDFFTKQHWRVLVVDSEELEAFVLPNGYIFVYKGLLKVIKNVDQLAVVLGHEMAHVLLQHTACYDIREGSNFFQLVSINEDITSKEWLSTHPAHENRVGQMNSLVPKMLDLRQTCKCPPLPKTDPRESMRKIMEEYQVLQEKKKAEERRNPWLLPKKVRERAGGCSGESE